MIEMKKITDKSHTLLVYEIYLDDILNVIVIEHGKRKIELCKKRTR